MIKEEIEYKKNKQNMELAYHIREILESIGIDPKKVNEKELTKLLQSLANKKDILDQIQSQQKGIPYEYQFGAICWWLKKCKHLQFMDPQPEFPYLSRINNVRYPDLFAIFSNKPTNFPCFIEIKVDNKQRLKLSKRYIDGLKKYPLLKDYPLLIAWKHKEFWVLFDIKTFITDKGNINVEFKDAMKANLMSTLAGDFSFKGFKPGIEWGYIIEPIGHKIDEIKSGKIKKFSGKLVDFYISNPLTSETMTNSKPIFYLLPYLGEWRPFTKYTSSHIISGEQNKFQISLFAYQTLIWGTQFQASILNQYVDWKSLLKKRDFIFTKEDILKLILEGRKKNMGFEDSPLSYLPSITNLQ